MRRILLACLVVTALSAVRADALTVRDVIELSKAGVGDDVLLALIDVDRSIFTLDAATVKQMKEAGVSDQVMIALIRSGRTPPLAPSTDASPAAQADPAPQPSAPEPQVIVIDHHDQQQPVRDVAVPVAFPVFVPTSGVRQEHVTRIVNTDDGGLVRVREPVPFNCTKAEPVFWGNGGKRRPGTWEPPPQIVCR